MNPEKIAILVDSGSDVPPELLQKYHMYVVPLQIHFSHGNYLDGVDITPQQVYEGLEHEIPKTSLPSGEQVQSILEQIAADGYEKVFAVCISSGLSGTFNMVRLVAEDFPGLSTFILDTRNISIGSGMLAIQAARLIEEGMGWEELCRVMPQYVEKSKVFFCLRTLEYLQKGGRIGKVAAAVGTAIALKPIITCNEEGVYVVAAKAIGHKAAVKKVLQMAQNFSQNGKQALVAVMHTNAAEECAALLREVQALLPHGQFVVQCGQISPALGVHTGPGLLGIGICLL